MKILFLSRWLPCPVNNGSKLRIYNLLYGLSQNYEVSLLSFQDQPNTIPDTSAILQICSKVQLVPYKPFQPTSLDSILGFLSPKPRSVINTFSKQMAHLITTEINTGTYDLVIASQIDMAIYHSFFQDVPALFEELEISTLYENFAQAENLLKRARHGLTWVKHRRYLTMLLKKFKACTTVSETERLLIEHKLRPQTPVLIMPNCVDLITYKSVPSNPIPNTLIFTGSFTYEPNYEAMVWFLENVYPHLLNEYPNLQLIITGNHANKPLPYIHNVTLTGFVDDIRPLLATSWVALAPIWTGGGTRLKILEAMALQVPVVSTSKGAEGLNGKNGVDLFLADSAQEFIEALSIVLQDQNLRNKIATNGYQFVKQYYDWSQRLPHFIEIVNQTAKTHKDLSCD